MPQISVLMPVWNGCKDGKEPFLRKAIESILGQTFSNLEMVIVDDGSTDNTLDVLKEYQRRDGRIRILKNDKNMKIVRTLNKGLDACQAPLVARQDADDYSTVTRLQIQKRFMDDRPKTEMCGTGMYVIDYEGKLKMEIMRPCTHELLKDFLLKKGCPFVHGSVMFRRETVSNMGGYSSNPDFEYAEDFELWSRIVKNGHRVENIPDRSLYFHRDHGTKSSVVYRTQQEKATRLILSLNQK